MKNMFAALEYLEDNGGINRVWDTIRDSINILAKGSIGHYDSKHLTPWFDKECSKLFDQRQQAKLQWLQNPSEVNEYNLSHV
jgi:hypothetical protein